MPTHLQLEDKTKAVAKKLLKAQKLKRKADELVNEPCIKTTYCGNLLVAPADTSKQPNRITSDHQQFLTQHSA